MIYLPKIWLGDADSYLRAFSALSDGPDAAHARLFVPGEDEEDDRSLAEQLADNLVSVHGKVGVLDINGPLVSETQWYNEYLGVISYDTISAASRILLEDDQVEYVVPLFNTGGGDAQGIEDGAANLELLMSVKPTISMVGSGMLSAGYFLGAKSKGIFGGKLSQIGSVGAIVTHRSVARALKQMGIDVTIFRGGKYKALGHPAEELSEEAKEKLKEDTAYLYKVFKEYVSEKRGVSMEAAQQWAEGQVFFTERAVEVGLADGMTTVNSLISALNNMSGDFSLSELQRELTNPSPAPSNDELYGGTTMAKKVILSQQQLAALQAGATMNEVAPGAQAVEDEVSGTEAQASEEAEAKAEMGDGVGDTVDARGTKGSEEGLKESKNASESSTDLVAYLKDELATARAELASANALAASATASAELHKTEVKMLHEIAVEATQRLQIGLGQNPSDMGKVGVTALAEMYQAAKSTFNDRFKVGPVSLGAEETEVSAHASNPENFGIFPVGKGR